MWGTGRSPVLVKKGKFMNILADGKRVYLRVAEESDIDTIMKWETDDENLKFIVPFSREDHLNVIKNPKTAMDIMIIEKEGDNPIGYFWIQGLELDSKEIEWTHIVIEKKGQGFGHEAMKLIKRYTFETLKAHRGWMDSKDYNERALHLYESEGLQREGLIRETLFINGVYENLVVLGILDREYFDRKNQGLENM